MEQIRKSLDGRTSEQEVLVLRKKYGDFFIPLVNFTKEILFKLRIYFYYKTIYSPSQTIIYDNFIIDNIGAATLWYFYRFQSKKIIYKTLNTLIYKGFMLFKKIFKKYEYLF